MASAVGAFAVDLDQHRVIDIAAERARHGLQTGFQAVGGQLDPVGQSRPYRRPSIQWPSLSNGPPPATTS